MLTPDEPEQPSAAEIQAQQQEKQDAVFEAFLAAKDAPIIGESVINDVFKSPSAIERINGRAAMIGFVVALYNELAADTSLWGQIFTTRTFTLTDGVEVTNTYPAGGFYLTPVCALVVLAASLAPMLKRRKIDGFTKPAEPFGPFTVEKELLNGRAAMVGLVSLLLAENFTQGNPLF